jgi:hypothetical protein
MRLLNWASACVTHTLEVNTMQNAQSFCARLTGMAAALAVFLPLAGCGGGQAAVPDRAEIDFVDDRTEERLERTSKLLEMYGSDELPNGSTSDYGTAEMTSLLDLPNGDGGAAK